MKLVVAGANGDDGVAPREKLGRERFTDADLVGEGEVVARGGILLLLAGKRRLRRQLQAFS